MDAKRRARYLKAMGIQAWRLRTPLTRVPAANSESVAAPAQQAPVPVPPLAQAPEAPALESPAVEAPAVEAPAVVPAVPVAVQAAPAMAESDSAWAALRAEVGACMACAELAAGRTQTVFGVGDPQARLMLIGEAPGFEEDRRGEPFVGPAGRLLDAMLAAIGLAREQVFIANILKCRPPKNRDPRPEEAAQCRGFLQRQIELVQPDLLLALGRIAAQNLLDTDRSLGRLRGVEHAAPGVSAPVMVTYHPAYLLRNPADKAKSWADLKQVRARLAADTP
jgi:DNA polymerase